MKWLLALLAVVMLAGSVQAAPVAKVSWRPVAKVAWKPKATPIGCRNCKPSPSQTQSQPDPLDGSELPDDLFGGVPDPRGGQGGGSGSGNTCYRPGVK